MRVLLSSLMGLNAMVFIVGAVQHAGVRIGPLREPVIIPAAIVEALCAIFLVRGVVTLCGDRPSAWRIAVIANVIALVGVLLGMIALAMGAGPRTATNDLYHRIMLALIIISLLVLFVWRSAISSKTKKI